MLSLLVTSPREPQATEAAGLALETLAPALRACIANILREPATHPDVQDGTQEALRRVVEHHAASRATEIRPWALGVARHVALDIIRRRQRERARRPREPQAPPESGPLLHKMADPQATPADTALGDAEERAIVRRAMDRLPEGQRQALILVHIDGLGYAETASRLGVPLGTVATWVARGRRAIAEELNPLAERTRTP